MSGFDLSFLGFAIGLILLVFNDWGNLESLRLLFIQFVRSSMIIGSNSSQLYWKYYLDQWMKCLRVILLPF